MDLLSTVTHEFGHILGIGHELMGDTLQVGVRQSFWPGIETHQSVSRIIRSTANQNEHPEERLFEQSLFEMLVEAVEWNSIEQVSTGYSRLVDLKTIPFFAASQYRIPSPKASPNDEDEEDNKTSFSEKTRHFVFRFSERTG